MKKIDMHVHASTIRQETGKARPWNPKDTYVADPDEIRAHLESQGIDHAVLMSNGENVPYRDNEACRRMADAQPDFYRWMCNFDPVSPETVYERMARYQSEGAIGVGEVMVNEWMDSPFILSLFDAAQRLNMPVTCHLSPEPGYAYGVCDRAGLPLLEKILKTFPELKFLGHSQVFWLEISADCPKEGNQERSAMGRGAVAPGGRVVELFEKYPNLYGDLSAYSGSCAILRDEAFGLAFLERYADRLFFATDTVNKYQTFPLGKFLDQAYEEGRLSTKAYRKICRENAAEIFSI